MDAEIRALVQAIHDSPGRVVAVTAGAGIQALAWLLGVAGASRTLLEALVPYDEASFRSFLGRRPEQFVAVETAGLLAGRAISRAQRLNHYDEPVVGLACTATIVTDRPKRGEHRAHLAAWTAGRVARYSLHLHKGARSRQVEEEMVSRLLLNALAQAYGLERSLDLPLLDGDRLDVEAHDLAAAAGRLFRGETAAFGVEADGRLLLHGSNPPALLSGSFNPLHDGHLALAEAAAEILGQPVTFELAAVNADKPDLDEAVTLQRLLQFAGRHDVLASDSPTFAAKARLFPQTTFVVGFDTAARVLQPRFYAGDSEQMLAALATIRRQGCCFLVAGRADDSGQFHSAEDLAVPEQYRDLFRPIPASRFRRDVSSTALRQSVP